VSHKFLGSNAMSQYSDWIRLLIAALIFVLTITLGAPEANPAACSTGMLHRRGPASIPGQFISDLCWREWHWDTFYSEYLCYPLTVIIPQIFHTHIIALIFRGWYNRHTGSRDLVLLQPNNCYYYYSSSSIGQFFGGTKRPERETDHL
jgi:hypothetical protein